MYEMTPEEKKELERQLTEWILAERQAEIEGRKNEMEMPLVRLSHKGRMRLLCSKLADKLRKRR